MRRYQDRQIKQVAEYTDLYQMLKGIVALKSSGFEGTSRDRWMNLHVGTLNAEAAETRLGERVGGALLLLRALVPAAVVFVGVEQALAGTMSIGMLVSFQLLQQSFLGPLDQVVRTLLQVQGLSVLVARMDDVLEAEPEAVPASAARRLRAGFASRGSLSATPPASPWSWTGSTSRSTKDRRSPWSVPPAAASRRSRA